MRFTGSIDAKVDEKGRVFVPSSFRKILQREEVASLVLRKDIFQPCLVLYPSTVWDAQVDTIADHTNMFNREGRDALRRFVAAAEHVTLDSGGRILISKRLLEDAGIRNEVRFLGMDNTIEIWNRHTADALLRDNGGLGDHLETMINAPKP